jgi:hypothetical protein
MKPIKNRLGHRYGRLLVKALHHQSTGCDPGAAYWLCQCDCGSTSVVSGGHLNSGRTLSCGCLATERLVERSTRHGHRGSYATPEYRIWSGIKTRCLNPKNNAYRNYGGRGITLHPEWRDDFAAFLTYVGKRPSPQHTIDRIDNNRGYEPGNIKWATYKDQANNKRSSVKHTVNGETLTLQQWSERLGIGIDKLRYRIWKAGDPIVGISSLINEPSTAAGQLPQHRQN